MNEPEVQAPTFEEAFLKLEDSVKRLEDPELPLEEALSIYEEGVRLAAVCDEMLETAELKVSRLGAKGTEVPMA
jgi:exodeoxyribonuclease VII small subunit